MVLASLYHLWYMTMTARGREFIRDIMLRPSDLKDVASAMRYYLGRTHDRPRFGRFLRQVEQLVDQGTGKMNRTHPDTQRFSAAKSASRERSPRLRVMWAPCCHLRKRSTA